MSELDAVRYAIMILQGENARLVRDINNAKNGEERDALDDCLTYNKEAIDALRKIVWRKTK